MKKNRITSLVAALAVSVLAPTFASANWSADGPADLLSVKDLEIGSSSATLTSGEPRTFVRFNRNPYPWCSAGSAASVQLVVGGNAAAQERILDTLTVALLSGRKVRVYVRECSGGGSSGIPVIGSIILL